MPAALDIDWAAVQCHYFAIGGDAAATAKAFNIRENTLWRRIQRGKWNEAIKEKKEQIAQNNAIIAQKVSEGVQRAGQSLAEMGEEVKHLGLKAVKKGLTGFLAKEVEPENWQEAKLAIDIAAKIGNWSAPTAAVQVNVWGAGMAASGCSVSEVVSEVELVDDGE